MVGLGSTEEGSFSISILDKIAQDDISISQFYECDQAIKDYVGCSPEYLLGILGWRIFSLLIGANSDE